MIIIREDQLTLPIANEQGFVDWYIDTFMPEHLFYVYAGVERKVLTKRVRYGRQIALSFGFVDPISLTHFVTFMWAIGPNFYIYSGFKEITEATYQPDMKRIDRFYDEVTDEQNMEARLGANEKAWNPDD